MPYNVKDVVANKPSRFTAGHRMCAGCGAPPAARMVMRALKPEDHAVVAGATGCMEVSTFIYPYTAWTDSFIHTAFECAGATLSGAEAAYNSLIKLCVDICKRNGIPKLVFTGDKNGSLTYHYMFAATACPGPWIKAHTQDICNKVNAQLADVKPTPTIPEGKYTVNLSANAPIYDAAGGKKVGSINMATKYTIVEDKKVGYITYGKLKSGAGWVVVKDETPKPTPSTTSFKTGDLVSIKSGARYYNGGGIPNWVAAEKWYISSISGNRAVLGQNEAKNRNIQSPINTNDITLVTAKVNTYTKSLKASDLLYSSAGGRIIGTVGATGVFTIVEDKNINGVVYGKLKSGVGWVICYNNSTIKVGDWVKVINPIIYGTTRKFTVFVDKYKVLEVNGDRLVISSDGKNVTSAIAKINVQKI